MWQCVRACDNTADGANVTTDAAVRVSGGVTDPMALDEEVLELNRDDDESDSDVSSGSDSDDRD